MDGYSYEDLLTAARNDVIFRVGGAAALEAGRQATQPDPASAVSAQSPAAAPAARAPEAETPKAAAVQPNVEDDVEESLSELHALIGKFLDAAKGSDEKRDQARVLIGEFKKRA